LWPRTSSERHPWFGKALAVTSLVSITIVSGGFVAGLKAGKIFNTFPMMGDYWIPPGVMALEPAWRNFFDNPATVQLNHRILAISTFFVVVTFWALLRKSDLSARATTAVHSLLAALIVQVSLGILTLLYYVPTTLAATHQAVAMMLFTAALYLAHCLRDAMVKPA